MMDWIRLLSYKRLCDDYYPEDFARTPDLHDLDRIVLSSAFRRLQDKTQVFPLPLSDYVRTRLTHSLESSIVGRSMGSIVGHEVTGRPELKEKFAAINGVGAVGAVNFGITVGVACLAHDIGNPPFGHSGEDAIQHWFRTSELAKKLLTQLDERQQNDFLEFDGNAQGFRILTRLQNAPADGGLRLTCSTLATFSKYPRESSASGDNLSHPGKSMQKHGFFQSEVSLFEEVAQTVGLVKRSDAPRCWARHPLAFLVEAADDLCYRIIDFEDGHRLGLVTFEYAKKMLFEFIDDDKTRSHFDGIPENHDKIAYLRGMAIDRLARQVAQAFLDREKEILEGTFDEPLVSVIDGNDVLEEIYEHSKEFIYRTGGVVEIEAAGFKVIGGLLECFAAAATDVANKGDDASSMSQKHLQLLPKPHRKREQDPYKRLLHITDYISGMTDSFAVALYKKIAGITIPNA